MRNTKILFIPGGSVPPKASDGVVKIYSKMLNTKIEMIPYPEYVEKDFRISLDNYKKYFNREIQKYSKYDLIIIGFSLGSFFALDLAKPHNIKVGKVILISPFLKRSSRPLTLVRNRIDSLRYQGKLDKKYAQPFSKFLRDYMKYLPVIYKQFVEIVMKLELDQKMTESNTDKIFIIGDKDNVITKLTNEELNMRNSKIYKIDGHHDIITSQYKQIALIIKENMEKV